LRTPTTRTDTITCPRSATGGLPPDTLPTEVPGEEGHVFDSAEEKAAKKRAREEEQARLAAEQQAAAEEKARKAWQASPEGRARTAKQAGAEFFELQLEVGAHAGRASWGEAGGQRSSTSSADTLGEIERAGWRLEHASHVFMVTGESSTERVLLSGQNTAVTGAMVGVYLFRNDRSVSAPAAGDSPAVP
jgi:hypothetical protein